MAHTHILRHPQHANVYFLTSNATLLRQAARLGRILDEWENETKLPDDAHSALSSIQKATIDHLQAIQTLRNIQTGVTHSQHLHIGRVWDMLGHIPMLVDKLVDECPPHETRLYCDLVWEMSRLHLRALRISQSLRQSIKVGRDNLILHSHEGGVVELFGDFHEDTPQLLRNFEIHLHDFIQRGFATVHPSKFLSGDPPKHFNLSKETREEIEYSFAAMSRSWPRKNMFDGHSPRPDRRAFDGVLKIWDSLELNPSSVAKILNIYLKMLDRMQGPPTYDVEKTTEKEIDHLKKNMDKIIEDKSRATAGDHQLGASG